jgi:hypothetical protein
VLNFLEVPLPAHSVTRDVKTALFKRRDRFYLVVVNNGDEDKSASVYLHAMDRYRGKARVTDLTTGHRDIYSYERRKPFSFEIHRKDGKVFEFTL